MNEGIDNALAKYLDLVQEYGDEMLSWSEDDVKGYLIEPLLDALGWNPRDPHHVRRQVPVTVGVQTVRADYVLVSQGKQICVVEAKAGKLDHDAAKQALSYASILRVPWALLTNGKEVRFYGVDFGTSDSADDALILDVLIDPATTPEDLASLVLLGREMLDSPEAPEKLKALHHRRALRRFLEKNKQALMKSVARWIEEQWEKGPVENHLVPSVLEELFGPGKETIIITGTVVAKCPKCGADLQKKGDGTRKTPVTAGDFQHAPQGGRGVFELISDPSKRIDVSLPGPEVEAKLAELGLKLSGVGAFGGFYYNLRRQAGLIRRR